MASLGATGSGIYAPFSSTKRSACSLNMHDTAASHFDPSPEGPFEASPEDTQSRWKSREIKLKNKLGMDLPPSTYRDHYPPKGPLPQEELPDETSGGPSSAPFDAKSTYNVEFPGKPFMPRPVEPLHYKHRPAPWLLDATTNQAHYKVPPISSVSTASPARQATLPPAQIPNTWETTHRRTFVPKEPPGRMPVGAPGPRPKVPWINDGTTYDNSFEPKEISLPPNAAPELGSTVPFSGTTEYKDQYQPKEGYPLMPPLTGYLPKNGLQLPMPRRSLGVQFWHKGVPDRYAVLIPRTLGIPCSAKRIFTTLHDNQDQASIHILYGDDPVATNNQLLGQFDIQNIPPAPKDVPQIEVTFSLDKNAVLTVTARDLDSARQKQWVQRGDICVLAGPH
ncbi:hypothetical protein DUNSADRAFT_226 [Dunaliella salina]|uniref:Encoded protein n=1 Tax=Dunaliella salina TaxID=3046 RepID=A0ABQ7GYJ4_DUNSA|nr:hypothetical protein DUNSADRAFT_226 [Dunaliella salina]|eukprot:KAF5839675.1 hypothetical protein DUNSADRAFT_226 [Dunaliella salina]